MPKVLISFLRFLGGPNLENQNLMFETKETKNFIKCKTKFRTLELYHQQKKLYHKFPAFQL